MKRKVIYKNKLALILTVLLIALSISACSGANNENTPPSPAATQEVKPTEDTPEATVAPENRDPVELTLVTNWTGEEPNIKAMFENFNKLYPWITVKFETVLEGAAAIVAKAVALQAAGTPADMIMPGELTSGAELYEDLTPYIENDPDLRDLPFPSSFMNTFKVDGKQLALPGSNAAPFLMFVNKDLLEKHGLEMPAAEWTYDDLLKMAQQATDPAAGEWGLDSSPNVARILTSSLAIANGSAGSHTFMNADGTESVANTPAVLADVQWVQELQTKHHVVPNRQQATEQGLSDAFMQGKALFTVQGPWMTGVYKDAPFEWDVLSLPYGTEKQATLLLTAPFVMLSASKHKEESMLYYKYLMSEEGLKFSIDWGDSPWGLSAELQEYLFTNASAWQGKNIDAIKQLYNGEPCCAAQGMNVVDYGEYVTAIDGGLDQILFDGASINDIFIPAADRFNATR
ncbi:hypothetical protein B1748_00640 [Paenibacillus sp. MY03]|jgi:multiple sugar transport system substrate-binding protein|uniref:ABC transporter substrate-binding protein n=1 Tax=Paenibacillus sp. MY03 TaxID=302980 RepID=UPI000B3C3C81|nr:extracellular solute-binding protein [Paenibacillus sp. MY03]OUS78617.1 hypothetical protein B1748_00640 [Paenibacillus sp. MY03]